MKWPVKASIAFIGFLLLVAATAAWLAPYDYDLQNVPNAYGSPSGANWFGTDALGRDLLSRLIYGCRISMSIALVTAASSVLIGLVYGTIAGYVGGNVEKLMMRVIDILYTLPSLIVMILVMLVFGRNLLGIFIALTATGWLGTARLMRAQVNSWKSRPFVEAARSLGLPHRSIVLKHILPNCVAPLIVELSYQIPTNILAEAFLSFLGIGIRPPTPSWGILAEEGWRSLQIHPHLTIFPGVAIFLTMLSFNFIGDYLRDRLDPFLQGR
jgi:oligopeptide transport system permease protein